MHTLLRRGLQRLRKFAALSTSVSLAAIATAAMAPAATAAPITLNLNIDLSRFIDVLGNQVAPVSSVHGEFTVTFDPLVTHSATAAGLTVHALSFVPSSTLVFRYNADLTLLSIGGEDNGPGNMLPGNTDLTLMVLMVDPLAPTLVDCSLAGLNCGSKTGNPDFLPSGYTLSGSPGHGWMASLGSVSATQVPMQVPEPGGLALAGLALAGLAATARRRGQVSKAALVA